jgi:hypothetical protein
MPRKLKTGVSANVMALHLGLARPYLAQLVADRVIEKLPNGGLRRPPHPLRRNTPHPKMRSPMPHRTAYAGQPQACVNRSSQNRSIHKLRVCLGSPERRRQIRRPPAIKYIVVRLVLGQFEPGAHSAGTWVVQVKFGRSKVAALSPSDVKTGSSCRRPRVLMQPSQLA